MKKRSKTLNSTLATIGAIAAIIAILAFLTGKPYLKDFLWSNDSSNKASASEISNTLSSQVNFSKKPSIVEIDDLSKSIGTYMAFTHLFGEGMVINIAKEDVVKNFRDLGYNPSAYAFQGDKQLNDLISKTSEAILTTVGSNQQQRFLLSLHIEYLMTVWDGGVMLYFEDQDEEKAKKSLFYVTLSMAQIMSNLHGLAELRNHGETIFTDLSDFRKNSTIIDKSKQAEILFRETLIWCQQIQQEI